MTNPNIRVETLVIKSRHLYKTHKALLHLLNLPNSLNLFGLCQALKFQFGSRLNTSSTAQPTTTHKQLPKLYFAHPTVKQLLLKSQHPPSEK